METDLLIKWLMGQCWLTGSSSGGAFPERVLEGNFSHTLAHFFSFFCEHKKNAWWTWTNKTSCYIKDVWRRIPLRSSRRWGFPLSMGVSPYLLQMLTWAPLVTRSWGKGQNSVDEISYHHQSLYLKPPPGGAQTSATWSCPQKQA